MNYFNFLMAHYDHDVKCAIKNKFPVIHTTNWQSGLIHQFLTETIQRGRMTNEIVPVRAEHSKSLYNDEANYNAGRAIDMNVATHSYSDAGSDGKFWWKLNLGQVHCVYQVINLDHVGNTYRSWTCSENHCSACGGSNCNEITAMTVSIEGTVAEPSPHSDCKYGDTVKLDGQHAFYFYELAVTKKPGDYGKS